MKNNLNHIAFCLLFLLFGCKSSAEKTVELNNKEKAIEYVKLFTDSYNSHQYHNDKLELDVFFDSEWTIKNDYLHYTNKEKQFVNYFRTNNSDVLFIGYNATIAAGVRATIQQSSLSTDEYFKNIIDSYKRQSINFPFTIKSQNTEFFKNFSGHISVVELALNKINKFTFEYLIIKINDYIVKIDFWIHSSAYDSHKEEFRAIYNTINFIENVDLTTDVIKP